MATRIKLRRDTAANWLAQNPILASGETGFETDTRMVKLGDGTTAWKDLKYAVTGDLQITGDTVHGDASVSLSSGVGNSENWVLNTVPNNGDPTQPTDAVNDGVAYDSQGNLFSMGWYTAGGGAYLQKVSPSGEVMWNNYYNEMSSYGFGLAVDRYDNAVMILSETAGSSNDIILAKVSGVDGSIIWQKYINSLGDYNDYASCIDTDHNGDIFVTGRSNDAGVAGNDAAHVTKFNGSNGTIIWSKQYTVDGFDSSGTGLVVDKDGNVGIVGSSYGPGNFVNMFKLNGTNGAILWQGKILNIKYDNGNNDGGIDNVHFGYIQSSDVATDTQGNFYLSFTWFHPYYPGAVAMVSKFNGTTGKGEWAQVLQYDNFEQSAGSVVCDELDNVYVTATLKRYLNNFDQGNYNRTAQNVTKINSTGSIIWQRWLAKEETAEWDSKNSWSNSPFGKSVAITKDYVAVIGSSYSVDALGENNDQNWYTQPYLAQLNRDGNEFNVDGWKFVDSLKETQSTFASVVNDDTNYTYDPAQVQDFVFTVAPGELGYQQNTDTTELAYVNRTNENRVTFSQKTLTLPAGGTLELTRGKLGYITAIGSFDGVEGSNQNGQVWLNGSARDDKGGSYAAGGWHDYNTWNGWSSYEHIPMVFKTDADGKLVWQAGNALDQNYSNPDLVDVIFHQPTNTVITLGNDGQLDGHEGFNILYLDADTGSMKQNITHIRPDENSTDIWPNTLHVLSDGSPVVGGYITGTRVTYANVTQNGAGLTGSTTSGTLVVPKSVFTVEGSTDYPKEDSTWYLYPAGSGIAHVNRFGYDESYPAIEFTGTLGSGATATVTILSGAPTSVAVAAGGTGYKPGHRLVIHGTDLGGATPDNDLSLFVSTVDSNGAVTAFDTTYNYGTLIDGTYTAVPTFSVAGSGLQGWVQYAPEGDTYTLFQIDNGGTYYAVGDTFKILGTDLGGATPANDLTMTVSTINSVGYGNGIITGVALSGTPQSVNIKLHGGSADYTVSGVYNIAHETQSDGFIWTPNWSRVFGGTATNSYDYFYGTAIDTSDNVIAGGYSESTGLNGSWYSSGYLQTGIITKFSSEGEILWTKSIDGSEGYSTVWGVDTDANDNIYSVMSNTNNRNGKPYITKLSPDGEFLWQQSIYVNYSYDAWSIAVTDNGDVLIAGRCYNNNWFGNNLIQGNDNILISKYDKDGNKLFSRILWSTNGLRMNYNDDYSGHLTIAGNKFTLVCYSYDPGDGNYQGTVIDLPLDGTGTGDYGDFHYAEIEIGYDYRFEQNNSSGFIKVTDVTNKIVNRPYTFGNAPYEGNNAWRNISIYGNRTAETQTVYDPVGAEIKGVAKITFADGSVQTSSQQGLPQVKMSQVNGGTHAYYLRPEDNGKQIYKYWNSPVVIPTRDRYDLPIGYAVTIITNSHVAGIVAEDNNQAMLISGGNGASYYSATVPYYTMATLVKIESGLWMIAGAGVTNGY